MRHENDQGSVRKFLGGGQDLSLNERIARPQVLRGEDRINRIKQDFRKPNPLNPVNPVYLIHRAGHGEVRHASSENLKPGRDAFPRRPYFL